MFCPKCGKELPTDSEVCPSCEDNYSEKSSKNETVVAPEDDAVPATAHEVLNTSKNSIVNAVKNKPKKFGIIAVAAVAVVALAAGGIYFGLQASGYFVLGQSDETFREALLQNDIVLKGVASNKYLNDSTYELVAYEAKNINKNNDNIVSAEISATIENANYRTELTILGQFQKPPEQGNQAAENHSQSYFFENQSSTTTPKKGIDYDKERGLTECNAPLSDDGKSCSVIDKKTFSSWFVDSTIQTTTNYTFDGRGWTVDEANTLFSPIYKNIEGDYLGRNNFQKIAQFTIGNLDPQKGTFEITCNTKESVQTFATYLEGKSLMKAVIDPKKTDTPLKQGGSSMQKDGYSYYFEASGTSEGGDGKASCSGFFSTNDSGDMTINIETISIDRSVDTTVFSKTDTVRINDVLLYK